MVRTSASDEGFKRYSAQKSVSSLPNGSQLQDSVRPHYKSSPHNVAVGKESNSSGNEVITLDDTCSDSIVESSFHLQSTSEQSPIGGVKKGGNKKENTGSILDLSAWISSDHSSPLTNRVQDVNVGRKRRIEDSGSDNKENFSPRDQNQGKFYVDNEKEPHGSNFPSPILVPKSKKKRGGVDRKLISGGAKELSSFSRKEMAHVNRTSRKKEEILSEMIIVVPRALYESQFDKEYFKETFLHPTLRLSPCEVPVISWRRKVTSKYSPNDDLFIPCASEEMSENTLVVLFKVEDFVDFIADGLFELYLDDATSRIVEHERAASNTIVFVEGYDQLVGTLKNKENRKFRNAILANLENDGRDCPQGRKSKREDDIKMSVKDIEARINDLQLRLQVNILPIRDNRDCIDWLNSFTYTIGNRYYDKKERNQTISNLGHVRSGNDTKSTFLQCLKQFKLMTDPKAEKLSRYFPSLYAIYMRCHDHNSLGKDENGKNIVPPSIDVAINKVFTSNDPNEVITE